MVTPDDEIPLLPTPAAAAGHRGPDYARAGREESGGDDLLTALLKLQQERPAILGTTTQGVHHHG
jgi:hypothetical protein